LTMLAKAYTVELDDARVVKKSYPNFWDNLKKTEISISYFE
jgi:5-enolpyruvylshikimate-3-phosphate synthase